MNQNSQTNSTTVTRKAFYKNYSQRPVNQSSNQGYQRSQPVSQSAKPATQVSERSSQNSAKPFVRVINHAPQVPPKQVSQVPSQQVPPVPQQAEQLPLQPVASVPKKVTTVQKPVIDPRTLPKLEALELDILKYIIEMRYLTADQINAAFSLVTEDAPEVFAAAFKKLETEKLIQEREMKENNLFIFVGTERGFEVLKLATTKERVPAFRKQVFQPRVRHDLLLNDVRVFFENRNFLNKWVPESVMKEIPLFMKLFTDYPDALCKKKDEKAYFLELEVSKKFPKAYAERIAMYREILQHEDIKKAGIEGVMFLCTDKAVEEMIKKEIPAGFEDISVLPYTRYIKNFQGSEYVPSKK